MTRLSKLIFLLVLLPALLCFARGDYYKSVACTTIVVENTATDSVYGINDSNSHQRFPAISGAQTYCKVTIELNENAAERTVHLEFWNIAKDTQYGGSSTGVLINDGGVSTTYTFTWASNAPIVPDSTAWAVYILQDSGSFDDVQISTYAADQTHIGDTDYDYWVGGNDRGRDAKISLYK